MNLPAHTCGHVCFLCIQLPSTCYLVPYAFTCYRFLISRSLLKWGLDGCVGKVLVTAILPMNFPFPYFHLFGIEELDYVSINWKYGTLTSTLISLNATSIHVPPLRMVVWKSCDLGLIISYSAAVIIRLQCKVTLFILYNKLETFQDVYLASYKLSLITMQWVKNNTNG